MQQRPGAKSLQRAGFLLHMKECGALFHASLNKIFIGFLKNQYLHDVRSAPLGALVFTSSAHFFMNIWLYLNRLI